MARDDTPRPVSGEIMAGPAVLSRASEPGDDIVEAEYDEVNAAPVPRGAGSFAPTAPAGGMNILRSIGGGAERGGRGGPLFWSVGLGLVAAAFWFSGGYSLLPPAAGQEARAPAARPLSVENVKSRVEHRNGRDVLFVEGETRNRGRDTMPVPAIAIAVTDGAGETTRYLLAAGSDLLRPGERLSFTSRVEAPGGGVRSVAVTFRE